MSIPQYEETEKDSKIYKVKSNYNSDDSGAPLFGEIDANTGKITIYSLGLGRRYIYGFNDTNTFKLNPENDLRVSAYLENSKIKDSVLRLHTILKSQTPNLVRQNDKLSPSEQTKILQSPQYRNVPSDAPIENTEGDVIGVKPLNDIEIKATNESQFFGTMRYPINSANTNLDYIRFQIFKPIPSKFDLRKDPQGKPIGRVGQFQPKNYEEKDRDKKMINLVGTIYLPIQPNISDNNQVNWQEDKLNLYEMTQANLSFGITGGSAGNIDQIFRGIGDKISSNSDAVDAAIKAITAGTLSKSGSNVFTRVTGAMLNPNMELRFSGPKLRQFTYTIKLTPRSPDEGKMVRKIIRAFKQNMVPRVAADKYFLQTPHIFGIDYVLNNRNTKIKGLNKIKKSALMSCAVNYTPANNYMPYTDGTMTSYELLLQFQELEPVYDVDYLTDNDIKLSNTEQENIPEITIGY